MKPMENNEQWKGGGDCQKCRRAKYCKKECRAAREYKRRIISQIIRERTGIDAMERAIHNAEE